MDRGNALRHPAWWCALGLLVLNDHVFKGLAAGTGATFFTGKLSDFAGLLVAPPLAALVLRRRVLGYAFVASAFAAINVSPMVAGVFEAALGWRIWVDPSDLVALPMTLVAWHLFEPLARSAPGRLRLGRRGPLTPALERAGLLLGGVACLATSQVENGPPWGPYANQLQIVGVFEGDGGAERELTVRELRDDVTLHCDLVAADLSLLSEQHFEVADEEVLRHHAEIVFSADADECRAVLVEDEDAGAVVGLFGGGRQTQLMLRRDGVEWAWTTSGVGRVGPLTTQENECEPEATLPDLDLALPAHGPYLLDDVSVADDGCLELRFEALPSDTPGTADPGTLHDAVLCGVPAARWPFEVGAEVVADATLRTVISRDGGVRFDVERTDATSIGTLTPDTCRAVDACGGVHDVGEVLVRSLDGWNEVEDGYFVRETERDTGELWILDARTTLVGCDDAPSGPTVRYVSVSLVR